MNKKMIVFFVVLLFSLSMVWADNNTTDTLEAEDNGHYILPVSISNGEIKFNDGFTGFNINPDKSNAGMSDKFLLDDFNGKNIENTVKLVIIEAYKQGKEQNIAQIISKLTNGDSSDNVIKEALNSNEKIGNNPVVKIDNSTEATFNFEYLKSVDDEKSDCIAYKVSMKTVEEPEILSNPGDDSDNQPVDETDDNDKTADDQKQSDDNKKTDDAADDQKQSEDNKKSDDTSDNKKNESDDDTTVNETNKTIINKTNTVIVNENNTTIINNNNVKTINNTNDTPENDTTSQLLKAAGNPILILIIVIVIIAIVAVARYRKD